MKQWKKLASLAVVMLVLCAASTLLVGKGTCCLCNSPSYSVPCLIDLETGNILELSLVGASTDGQTPAETFSFIRFGNITGIRQAPDKIELNISTDDYARHPALCSSCRRHLPQGYDERYVLADFESRELLPIRTAARHTISGYQITVAQSNGYISVIIE
jgi:hypothetical protein